MRLPVFRFLKQIMLLVIMSASLTQLALAQSLSPTGIDDRDLIQIKWKEIKANSHPLGFSLAIFVCGVEIYQCRAVTQSKVVWLESTGSSPLDQLIKFSGAKVNRVIQEEIDRPSTNYQFAVHFYRHQTTEDKELMGVTDVKYGDIEVDKWREYRVSEPFDSYFDPSKFVNTHFDFSKLQDQDYDDVDQTGGPVGPGPLPPPTGGLSLQQYEEIISTVEQIYLPLASVEGKRLKFIRQWDSPIEDAISGYEEDASGMILTMKFPGGLARHERMGVEAYTMVVCHELGHHLGGAPFFPGGASVEGQADYFASYDCIRRVLLESGRALENDYTPQVPSLVKFFCRKAYPQSLTEQKTCQAIAKYGLKVTSFFATKKGKHPPKFETPSLEVATRYYEVGQDPHPPLQCRLDTYLAAALCNQHPTRNNRLAPLGQVNPCQTKEYFSLGERPVCWFIPGQQGMQ